MTVKGGLLYYETQGIGSSKYAISFHDGIKTHKDGSEFYDLRLFRNKKNKNAFIEELRRDGYRTPRETHPLDLGSK